MSRTPLRLAAGLAVALSLAAFAWPAAGDDSDAEPLVRTAAVSDPVVVGPVDEAAVRSTGTVLTEVSASIAEDLEARYAEHLAAVAAWEEAEAIARWQAAEAAAEAERLAIEAQRAEEARIAEEARRAEQERAAAAAPSGSLESIIHRHFGSAGPAAVRIAQCESSMNPNAVSPTNDHGLFQINIVHRGQFEAVTGAPWSSVYDPELNTIYARHLYGQQGWGPWACA
jgi:hypothetical protein